METEFNEMHYLYPLAEAEQDITRWNKISGDINAPHAYFLKKEDLIYLLQEMTNIDSKAMGIRCYPARDEAGEDHMLMVAVVEDDTMIHDGTIEIPKYPNGRDVYYDKPMSMIFDLTRPCPRMCDEYSALYEASIIKTQVRLEDLKTEAKGE